MPVLFFLRSLLNTLLLVSLVQRFRCLRSDFLQRGFSPHVARQTSVATLCRRECSVENRVDDRFRPLFFILSGAYFVQMFSANYTETLQ